MSGSCPSVRPLHLLSESHPKLISSINALESKRCANPKLKSHEIISFMQNTGVPRHTSATFAPYNPASLRCYCNPMDVRSFQQNRARALKRGYRHGAPLRSIVGTILDPLHHIWRSSTKEPTWLIDWTAR